MAKEKKPNPFAKGGKGGKGDKKGGKTIKCPHCGEKMKEGGKCPSCGRKY